MKKLTKALTLISSIALAPLAMATHFYDYGNVTYVEPIYETVTVSSPVKTCYEVTERHGHYNPAPSIVGAVIGGVIGHAIGDNRHNRRFGRATGMVLGAAIGHEVGHNNHRSGYHTREVCEIDHQASKPIKTLSGYNVEYKYKGKTYETFMHSHPGKKVKLKVSARSASNRY